MRTKITMLGLALFALAASAVLTAAEARPGHGHHGHFYRGPRVYFGPVYPVYPLVSDCSYSRMMWRRTGRNYWKWRYYECRGW